MSTSDISPRPWKVSGNYLVMDADSNSIAMFDGEHNDIDAANAAHAVACVNACEGLDPAAEPGMAERLQEAEVVICLLLAQVEAEHQLPIKDGIIAAAQRFLESNRSHD